MTQWVDLDANGSSMRTAVAQSARADDAGVLVCMHGPGVDAFILGICEALAGAGFTAVAPDLYHRQKEPDPDPLARLRALRDVAILDDLTVAARHLATLSDPLRRHVIGFCMGGRLSYLWATEDLALRSAVVFYGGGILRSWGEGSSPFERTGGIRCPVLGLFGKEDTNPSPADVAAISSEMDRLAKPHEFVSYDGAGHAFLNEARPSYREEAARDAWRRCIAWLQRHSDRSAD